MSHRGWGLTLLVLVSCVVGELDWRTFGENILVMLLCPHFSIFWFNATLECFMWSVQCADFKCYIYYQQPVMWWSCLLWQLCVLDEGEQRVRIWCKMLCSGYKGVFELIGLCGWTFLEVPDGRNCWLDGTIRKYVSFFSYITVFVEILQSFMCSSSYFTADIHHSVGYILCLTLGDCWWNEKVELNRCEGSSAPV